jgi:hypothetical protein
MGSIGFLLLGNIPAFVKMLQEAQEISSWKYKPDPLDDE